MPDKTRAGAEPRPAKAKYPAWYASALRLYSGPFQVTTERELDVARAEFGELPAGERAFYPVHMLFLGLQALWMVVRLLMECRDGLEEVADLHERGLPAVEEPVVAEELPPEPEPPAKEDVIPLGDGVDLIVPPEGS